MSPNCSCVAALEGKNCNEERKQEEKREKKGGGKWKSQAGVCL